MPIPRQSWAVAKKSSHCEALPKQSRYIDCHAHTKSGQTPARNDGLYKYCENVFTSGIKNSK
ncbi:hypothetical protein EPJ64_11330 [Brachyspira aalborgi]|uniref:Uncharacterized protein n=2 Tax=Brachyspira aalborgi TaxID=29522 RepID=A0A5C8E9P1_9SPIR|nr:hypothetical protein [Brachyspira aalborgi]MBS4764096.1 hypothetical protein [Brachyspira sp.]TXJ14885.1 hypothetical protein EPJ77_06890 [Brachyspira aalborgi]TXJ18479.1 hypothetical protein EPJ64_11330 [Brachyspira aalborgi]TXJ19837.1 hypothetical protein EPJ79_01375 [Brachyspira aalborgi]TXJ24432.1 hypothetical protein EPJ73_11415 [Brachyspira aalborgi]